MAVISLIDKLRMTMDKDENHIAFDIRIIITKHDAFFSSFCTAHTSHFSRSLNCERKKQQHANVTFYDMISVESKKLDLPDPPYMLSRLQSLPVALPSWSHD